MGNEYLGVDRVRVVINLKRKKQLNSPAKGIKIKNKISFYTRNSSLKS